MTRVKTMRKATAKLAAQGWLPLQSRKAALLGALVILAFAAFLATTSSRSSAPQPTTPVAQPTLSAHGSVEPVAQATIATMSGGIVRSLAVRVGQAVNEGQVVAQISTASETETLVAPWDGTVIGLYVRRGDTVMPGTAVATIGDLSRYQVRTNDVDEYLIGQIQPGQQVTMSVEALDGRKLRGAVETVALAQQTSAAGVVNYPVVIRLLDDDPDLRPGMTVRIVFLPR